MRLVQARIVTDNVAALAAFYARLVGADVVVNDYYVEVPTLAMSIGLSRRRFTEHSSRDQLAGMILDFETEDADAEYERIAGFGMICVLPPRTQPWGSRSMMFADPEGNLINVFSRQDGTDSPCH